VKTLILTVGLPRSGKTWWAHKQDCPIVNPDSIRLALHGQRYIQLAEPFVWAIATVMVRALFLAGADKVILDATNTTYARRNAWKSDDWQTWFKVIPTSKQECLNRAAAEGDTYIPPIIERQAMQFEPLTEDEAERAWWA